METIRSILNLVTPHCWMASIDLKDAYYSVKIHESYQKYLKFKFEGRLFQYTTYANGLSSSPRRFTKLLKPPLSELRLMNHIVSAYIDDLYLQSASFEGCVHTVVDTITLFDNLRFVIHPEKSQFIPKQQDKASELQWWSNNITTCYNNIAHAPITATVYSDASLKGWGAAMNDTSTRGQWSDQESTHHINYLELLAAFRALKVYQLNLSDQHIKIMIGNKAAVGIINNLYSEDTSKDKTGESIRSDGCTKVANSIMVSNFIFNDCELSSGVESISQPPFASRQESAVRKMLNEESQPFSTNESDIGVGSGLNLEIEWCGHSDGVATASCPHGVACATKLVLAESLCDFLDILPLTGQ
eukprot:gene10193-11240_t